MTKSDMCVVQSIARGVLCGTVCLVCLVVVLEAAGAAAAAPYTVPHAHEATGRRIGGATAQNAGRCTDAIGIYDDCGDDQLAVPSSDGEVWAYCQGLRRAPPPSPTTTVSRTACGGCLPGCVPPMNSTKAGAAEIAIGSVQPACECLMIYPRPRIEADYNNAGQPPLNVSYLSDTAQRPLPAPVPHRLYKVVRTGARVWLLSNCNTTTGCVTVPPSPTKPYRDSPSGRLGASAWQLHLNGDAAWGTVEVVGTPPHAVSSSSFQATAVSETLVAVWGDFIRIVPHSGGTFWADSGVIDVVRMQWLDCPTCSNVPVSRGHSQVVSTGEGSVYVINGVPRAYPPWTGTQRLEWTRHGDQAVFRGNMLMNHGLPTEFDPVSAVWAPFNGSLAVFAWLAPPHDPDGARLYVAAPDGVPAHGHLVWTQLLVDGRAAMLPNAQLLVGSWVAMTGALRHPVWYYLGVATHGNEAVVHALQLNLTSMSWVRNETVTRIPGDDVAPVGVVVAAAAGRVTGLSCGVGVPTLPECTAYLVYLAAGATPSSTVVSTLRYSVGDGVVSPTRNSCDATSLPPVALQVATRHALVRVHQASGGGQKVATNMSMVSLFDHQTGACLVANVSTARAPPSAGVLSGARMVSNHGSSVYVLGVSAVSGVAEVWAGAVTSSGSGSGRLEGRPPAVVWTLLPQEFTGSLAGRSGPLLMAHGVLQSLMYVGGSVLAVIQQRSQSATFPTFTIRYATRGHTWAVYSNASLPFIVADATVSGDDILATGENIFTQRWEAWALPLPTGAPRLGCAAVPCANMHSPVLAGRGPPLDSMPTWHIAFLMRNPLFNGEFTPALAAVGSTVFSLVRHVTMFKGSRTGAVTLHAHARCDPPTPGPRCPVDVSTAKLDLTYPLGVVAGLLRGPLVWLFGSLYALLDGVTIVLRLVSCAVSLAHVATWSVCCLCTDTDDAGVPLLCHSPPC